MTRRIRITLFAMLTMTCLLASQAMASTITVTPDYSGLSPADVVGAAGDYPQPQWAGGSWQSGGNSKSQAYFTPSQIFGRENVRLGEIASMSYWTKKDTTHVENAGDWYLQIYTKPFENSPGSGWYGYRVTSEPYFSMNLTETPGSWTQWMTGGTTTPNSLRFFDSAPGYYGGYTDPLWADFLALAAEDADGLTRDNLLLADQEILYVTVATGNPWADGFEGLLDGLSFNMTSQETFGINFDAAPVPEPSSIFLLLAGGGAMAIFFRKRATGNPLLSKGTVK